ncbi:MAG: hypothetical protein AWM53_01530 [Candidatus Dichloromethanomonas elyunquensis]|nr:MAG: hypothetical protein AWM53_01530 [Candidatus Dichloromethanomonas elyunquensis]
MTYCEMHKPSGCGECPNCYICKNREFNVGEFLRGEKITRISKTEKALITEIYNRGSCCWQTNFYDLETLKHKFSKAK